MKKYVIEREIPGVGAWTQTQLRECAETSCEVLAQLAPDVQWVESYVVEGRTFCIYLATDGERVREHARLAGFPANRIHEVRAIIDPTTATARPLVAARA